MLPAGLEGAGDTLEPGTAHRDDVEGAVELRQLGMRGEIGVSRASEPTLFLGTDHLEGVAVTLAALALDLDEDEPPATTHDEVQLVSARPDVRIQDAVAAQPVMPEGAQLRGVLQAASPW